MGGVFGPDPVCVVSSAVALAFLQVVKPSAAQGAAGVALYISEVSLSAGRDSLKPPSVGRAPVGSRTLLLPLFLTNKRSVDTTTFLCSTV